MLKAQQDIDGQRQQFWREHLKNWSESGLTQKEYCRINNLKATRFTYWKTKFNNLKDTRKTNLPVEFIQISDQPMATGFLKLNVGADFQIEIPDGFSRSTFEQVLTILRAF
jgi:hypothetical protein